MPASGVSVPDDCIQHYENMKLRKKQRCIIYVIDPQKMEFKILKEIEKIDDQKEQFEKIVKEDIRPVLERVDECGKAVGNCCFVVWDLKMLAKGASKGGQESEFLVFMGLCLDDMPVKERMMYSSSIKALKEKLTGIPKVLEVKSLCDLDYECVMGELK